MHTVPIDQVLLAPVVFGKSNSQIIFFLMKITRKNPTANSSYDDSSRVYTVPGFAKRLNQMDASEQNNLGMGGFGARSASAPEDKITYPKNWDAIAGAQGEDPNRRPADSDAADGLRVIIYDVADSLAASNDEDYQPNEARINQAVKRRVREIEAIAPESWRSNGGQGQIDVHGLTKLIILQTPDVHEKIADYLAQRRKQVAIEARFILADDNLLQGIVEEAVEPMGTVIEGAADSEEIKAAIEDKPLTERELPVLDLTAVNDETVKRIKTHVRA
jgi:hypothetical protein